MRSDNVLEKLALGAAAGLAGTLAINALNAATHKLLPQTKPPMRDDPGEFMVKRAESLLPESARERVSQSAEKAASNTLAMGYGMTFCAVYSALRPAGGPVLLDG